MLLLILYGEARKAHPEDALTLELVIHNTSKSEMLPGERLGILSCFQICTSTKRKKKPKQN